MTSILQRIGLLTGPLLVTGLLGCGPELSTNDVSLEPLASLETHGKALTVDPTLGTLLPSVGGGGGTAFFDACPIGYVGTGLNIRYGNWLDQIQLICRKLNLDGTLGATATTPARGGGGGVPATGHCANNQIMAGQMFHASTWISRVGTPCATAARLKYATGGDDSWLFMPGNSTGPFSFTACPAGQAITGISGRAGSWVDQLGFKCGKLDDVKSTVNANQGFTYQVSNVRINGSGPSSTLAANQDFWLDVDFSARDTACPGCVDQIIVGLVSSDPLVPQQPLTCLYSGSPGSGGVVGISSVLLKAPSQPGTYTLRVHYGQDTFCNPGRWWSGTALGRRWSGPSRTAPRAPNTRTPPLGLLHVSHGTSRARYHGCESTVRPWKTSTFD